MDEPKVPLSAAFRAIDGMGASGQRAIDNLGELALKMWHRGILLGFLTGFCLAGSIGAFVISYLLRHRP